MSTNENCWASGGMHSTDSSFTCYDKCVCAKGSQHGCLLGVGALMCVTTVNLQAYLSTDTGHYV